MWKGSGGDDDDEDGDEEGGGSGGGGKQTTLPTQDRSEGASGEVPESEAIEQAAEAVGGGDDLEGGWDPVTDDMGYGDFDDKQILVDGEVYHGSAYNTADDEVWVEELDDFEGFDLDEIDGVRPVPDDDGDGQSDTPDSDGNGTTDVDFEPFDGDVDDLHGDVAPGLQVELTNEETGESIVAAVSESHGGDNPYTVFTTEDHGGLIDTFGDFDDQWSVTGISSEGGSEGFEYDPDEHTVKEYLEDGVLYKISPEFETPKEKMIEYGSDFFERLDDRVATTALNHIGEMEESATGRANVQFAAGADRDTATVRMGRASRRDTHNHELGHLVADAHGFGITTEAARYTDQKYNTDEDNFVEIAPENRDGFKLLQRDGKDVPDNVQRLMDEVNKAWEKLQDAGPENAAEHTVRDNYSSTNAHEYFAQLNEVMHQERAPLSEHMSCFEQNPDLAKAYTDVFEPSESAKTVLQHYHREHPDKSPYDSDPYPEVMEADG